MRPSARIIVRYSGTLERYAGDGVMVVFNDPVPVDNPAIQAMQMALEMREAIGALTQKWRQLGHEIGFGIGMAENARHDVSEYAHDLVPRMLLLRSASYPALRANRISRLCSTATHYGVIDQQHHRRAHHRDDHAVNVQACDSGRAKQIKEKTADESANDSKGDVEPETLTLSINDLASDEPGDQAEDDPADDPHLSTSFCQPGLGSEGLVTDTPLDLSRSREPSAYYCLDTSYHSRCFLFGRQPAVRRELIDQVRQMLTQAGEQILTSHASMLA
jgi:hypothetical protein